jgi:hypothetical protein
MSKTIPKHATREGWLIAATDLLRTHFKTAGYEIPAKLHVSCGWPSRGGTGTRKYPIGECWPEKASEDKACHIFISPRLTASVTEAQAGVLPVLVHELVHAVVGCKEKHNKVFKKAALAVGLEGKMTATHAGESLMQELRLMTQARLGDYPHPALQPGFRLDKKQTTRLIKAECGECGCNVRITRKWLEEVGAPLCACNKQAMAFEIPKELEGDGEDE